MIQVGDPPYLECSGRGDKRFSAFYARIRARRGKSIEQLYQESKRFDNWKDNARPWRRRKGLKPVNVAECRTFYSQLWDEYIQENPELVKVLISTNGLQDMFGQAGHACQALELWRIRSMYVVNPSHILPPIF